MWTCGARLRANRVFIAVMAAGIDFARIEAVARTVAAKSGYNNLKQELVQAVVEFVRWRDALVSLLAAASLLIYGILPRSFNEHRNGRKRRQLLWLLVHCRH